MRVTRRFVLAASAAAIVSSRRELKASTSRPGMVWIPGGEYWMGAQSDDLPDALPVHRVALDGFWMDRTTVTNAQFARFVAATKYVTVAERPLNSKDFPGVPKEKLKPGGVVFTPPGHAVSLDDPSQWWSYVAGTNWRHPDGPTSSIAGKDNYPVVQIAWEDAQAYSRWAKKRLPTEAEFEYAARGGLDRQLYPWGSELKPGGKWQANIFEGHFPDAGKAEDGFSGRAPVGSFAPNGFGLWDMAGNVWEWCSDWYRPDSYRVNQSVVRNPPGPADGYDPDEPNVPKRVQRGGSFLCTSQYCQRYLAGARGKADPNTPSNHAGFRCVA